MPGFDQTGPMGQGPMTGGRRGRCAGAVDYPRTGRGLGYGAGYGRGLGRGWYGRGAGYGFGGRGYRNEYYATGLTGWQRAWPSVATDATAASATTAGTDRLVQLESRLEDVLNRLARLERTE